MPAGETTSLAGAIPDDATETSAARALEALHEASFAWALVVCRYDRAEAEDVLSETYLQVLDGRARWGGEAALRTWLFAVIRRTAASRRRRAWLRRTLLLRWRDREPAAPAPPAADALVHGAAQGQRILAAVRALAPRQRQVIELVFYHDLTVEEAAAAMGVGVGTARAHYDRGKRRLCAALEEERP